MKYVSILILFYLLMACKTVDNNSDSSWIRSADQVIFMYDDASVPPDDHRSYTITISSNKMVFEVDSYGDIIRKDSLPITTKKWKQIQNAFIETKIDYVTEKKNPEGCTGGSGNRITVMGTSEKIFSGRQYRCGGFNEGNLSGDIEAFEKAIREGLDASFFRLD